MLALLVLQSLTINVLIENVCYVRPNWHVIVRVKSTTNTKKNTQKQPFLRRILPFLYTLTPHLHNSLLFLPCGVSRRESTPVINLLPRRFYKLSCATLDDMPILKWKVCGISFKILHCDQSTLISIIIKDFMMNSIYKLFTKECNCANFLSLTSFYLLLNGNVI
jgi:hypothetical protein